MMNKSITIIYRIILVTFAILIISFLGLLFWLSQESRSLDFAKPYIEKAFSNQGKDISIGKSSIWLNSAKKTIDLSISEVLVKEKESGHIITKLPSANIKIYTPYLLIGQVKPKFIELTAPEFYMERTIAEKAGQTEELSLSDFVNRDYFQSLALKHLLITDGKVTIKYNDKETILDKINAYLTSTTNKGQINIDSKVGLTIYDNEDFKLEPKLSFSALCIATPDGKDIKIEQFNLNIGKDASLTAKANIKDFKSITLTTNIKDLPSNMLKALWPSKMQPYIREWAVDNIENATINKASGSFNFNLDDFEQNKLPDGAIDAHIELSGAKLNYYPGLPTIKSINANLDFDANKLTINISKGAFDNSVIERAIIDIPYQGPLIINGKVKGKLIDLIDFIPDEQIAKAKKNNLNLKKIQGSASTEVKNITIPFKDDLNFSDIIFDINSTLTAVALDHLPNNISLTNGNFKLNFDGEKINVGGEAKLDNHSSTINWAGFLKEDAKYDTTLNINTTMVPENLTNLVFLNEKFFTNGKISIQGNFTSKKNIEKSDIKANLDEAELFIDQIGFKKPIGQKANADIKATIDNDNIKIDKMVIKGDDIDIEGKIELSRALMMANNAKFSHMRYNKNDLAVDFIATKYGYKLNIAGSLLNLKDANFTKLFASSNDNSKKDELIDIQIDKAIMKNNVTFTNLNAHIDCTKDTSCNKVKLSSLMNEKNHFNFSITPISNDVSIITGNSDNAALVTNAFDIYKNIKNGTLSIEGKRTVVEGKAISSGIMKIIKFTALKTPILSNIVSIISITSFAEAFKGNEINFDLLEMPFKLADDIIEINKGKIEGWQIDLTLEGNLDTKNRKLNLNGTAAPDIMLVNKIVSNIPLIGKAFKGRGGLIAANYSVKGSFDNPSTTVNPLSILTPGPLRHIFDVFDHNNADEKTKKP